MVTNSNPSSLEGLICMLMFFALMVDLANCAMKAPCATQSTNFSLEDDVNAATVNDEYLLFENSYGD